MRATILAFGLMSAVGCAADTDDLLLRPMNDAGAEDATSPSVGDPVGGLMDAGTKDVPVSDVMRDAGEEDASNPTSCALVSVQLTAERQEWEALESPIDVRADDGQIYVAVAADQGLVLATLSDQGELIREELLGAELLAKTPRIFVRRDGEPAVVVAGQSVGQLPRSNVKIVDSTGTRTLLEVDGTLSFGIDASARVDGRYPPIAVAFRSPLGDLSAELRRDGSPPIPLDSYGESLAVMATASGFAVVNWNQDELHGRLVDASGVVSEPIRSTGYVGALHRSYLLRTARDGAPMLFFSDGATRLTTIEARRIFDADAESMVVHEQAGTLSRLAFSAAPYAAGWAVVWRDFRDGYTPEETDPWRNLYFRALGDESDPVAELDRLIVAAEGTDVDFPSLVALPDGRFAAAYLLGSQVHVVVGDFSKCPARLEHTVQRR